MVLFLAGCGSNSTSTAAAHAGNTPVVGTPTPSPTVDIFASPTPQPTAGLPCTGGIWGNIIAFAGPGIPLPPLTVSGAAESFASGSWTGTYVSLCTGGTTSGIETFTSTHMSELGWAYYAPPANCLCNGAYVWSKTGDSRLVQFESHPNQSNGQVRWGVTIYLRSS
jgi:hypothetical protein